MKYGKPSQSLLLVGFGTAAFVAQVRERLPVFPPDIIPPKVLQRRDPLRFDPRHYRLEFENEKVRVLRLTLKADEMVPFHDDSDSVVVCLKECHVRFMLPDGRSEDVHMEVGAARWIYGDTRSEKNLGTKSIEMLFVETKSANAR
jgi:hypothetical protein